MHSRDTLTAVFLCIHNHRGDDQIIFNSLDILLIIRVSVDHKLKACSAYLRFVAAVRNLLLASSIQTPFTEFSMLNSLRTIASADLLDNNDTSPWQPNAAI